MPRTAPVPTPPVWPEDEPDIDIIEPATVPPIDPIAAFDAETTDDDVPEMDVIRAVTVAAPTSNSVIVGLGALAAMSDEEYEAKKLVMTRGLARVVDIQQSLMIDKQDYGRVPGISKPFLQLPGAEKLANFYGYAVRQEADRVTRKPDEGSEVPPLAYHVRSYVHLGSFDGPVVAQGYGEANSYEEKYRWRWEYPKCARCGHDLMKGKPDSAMAGKYYCPGFKGGCWAKYELADVPPPAKVENSEPYGLAETLIQIAGKRSFVASIRRATGTSGLFSQDDDSPSVQQQADDAPSQDAPEPNVTAAPAGIVVGVGAKSEGPTELQRRRLKELATAKGIGGTKMAEIINRVFGRDIELTGQAASAAAKGLNGVDLGRLIAAVETGEIPETPAERHDRIENEPVAGFPPQDS